MSCWEKWLLWVAGGAGGGVSVTVSPAFCGQNIKGTWKLKALSQAFCSLRVHLLQDRSNIYIIVRVCCIFLQFSPFLIILPMCSPASKERRCLEHSKHSHSFASDLDGFSQCHRPGWWPQCSFPCNLSSRLLQYSCLIGKDACCHCSAKGKRGRIGHCRLSNSKEKRKLSTF